MSDATAGEQPDPIDPPVPAEAPLQPEVMQPPEPGQDLAHLQGYSNLERAAEAAINLPGLPGREEFLSLAMQARILAMSAGAPKAVRDNPHLAFHIAMIGRDLGISPSAALQMVDVIGYNERGTSYEAQYDRVQLSISPELLNSQIKRMGLGSIVKAASHTDECTAVAMAPGGHLDTRCARTWPEHVAPSDNGGPCTCTMGLVLGEVTFTWKDAQLAGLVDDACTGPDAHTAACVQGGSGSQGKRCHQGYRSYPQRMMWWRASGWAQSDYFPEAGVGLYSPEELGAMVDSEGRAIDPAAVELPEGYEPKPAPPPPPSEDLLADAADDDELGAARRDLRARIDALAAVPDAQQALRDLWQLRDDEGVPKLPPFPHLRRRHLTMAKAMVLGIEQRIKRKEWGDEAAVAWADASVGAAGFGNPDPKVAAGAHMGGVGGADEPDAPAPAADADSPTAATGSPDAADEAVAAYERAVLCACGAAEAPASMHDEECPVGIQWRNTEGAINPDPEPIELPAGRPTLEQITTQVAILTPTEVMAQLTERLPEGAAMPRSKDGRQVRLVDLIVAQLDAAPASEATPDEPEQLGLDASAPPAE